MTPAQGSPELYSTDRLLEFLEHAAERGLMPGATAQALASACRTVFQILAADERQDVRSLDLGAVARRFQHKRAKDFTPDSLKTYDARVRRAVKLFTDWRDDPAHFTVPTRSTVNSRRRINHGKPDGGTSADVDVGSMSSPISAVSPSGVYSTAVPLRPGTVVMLHNVPTDLTSAEAERLAQFVRMLAVSATR